MTPNTADGTVTFKEGALTLGSTSLGAGGSGSIQLSSLTTGIHTLTAIYGGNATLSGSTSLPRTQTVRPTGTVLISNGMSAREVIGQYEDETVSPLAPIFTKGGANNGPNRLGLNMPYGIALDTTNHRLFVSYWDQNRVLIFNLASDNTLSDSIPDYVLGQTSFTESTAGATQARMNVPQGLAYDAKNNRLFVAEYNSNRIIVFSTAAITNGMNAMNVLGQSDYKANSFASTQAGMYNPRGLAIDTVNSRLFVADTNNNRVTVFNVSSISNGMNAMNVLGQSSFTRSSWLTTQAGMYNPYNIAFDAANNRLFVADYMNNRVTVFNTTSISNGMNAANVLGQRSFSTRTTGMTQALLYGPQGIAYDARNNRLFVAEYTIGRVTVFNVSFIENGMNATYVLGQSSFTASVGSTTQAGMSGPEALAYDAANNRLFVAEYNNNRVTVFNTATITNGMNAMNVLGQYADETANPLVPVYTKGTTNNALNRLGMNSPWGIAIDTTNHRLFVSEYMNNRVLVYNLDTNNSLTDRVPDYVLGQSDFSTNATETTQAGMSRPRGIAVDSVNNRLFVADSEKHRVTVFNIASITNGMNAVNVLGQSSFTTSNAAMTQAGMYYPNGVAYDASNNRLFVAETYNRVTVFNLSSITNGMNAMNVLGQSSFTTSNAATTQAGMSRPYDLAYDSSNSRLFVADGLNSRVTVFNVASVTNGMNATYVLGQGNFTASAVATTQAGIYDPKALAYDAMNNRLFVADCSNNRVIVFTTTSIINGMNAISVLGQSNFTVNSLTTTQAGMSNPVGLAYNAMNNRLFVADSTNNRVMLFDVGVIQSSVTLSGSPNPSAYNANTTLTATMTPSTVNGTVTFMNGAATLGTATLRRGSGSIVVSTLPAGTSSLTAIYTGSGYYMPSTSAAYVQTVNKGTPTVTLTGPTPVPAGMASLSALLSPASATGTVTFFEGEAVVGSGMVIGGIASAGIPSLGMGTHTVTATYNGNANLLPANSASFVVTVTKGNSSTVLVSTPDPSDTGNGVTLIAAVSPATATGTVTFYDSATTLGTAALANGTGSIVVSSLTNGIHTLTAVYAGNATLSGSTSLPRTQTVHPTSAVIANGMNAREVIGQYEDETVSPMAPVFTKGTANNGVNRLGLKTPYGITLDGVNHRLFVADYGNNRVLVYNLATNNSFPDFTPDFVLGQGSFMTNASATTQAGMYSPSGLVFDTKNRRLFVAENNNHRVTVFSTATITNGMNAMNVLGPSSFTTISAGTTQALMTGPQGLAYDASNSRLFVSEFYNYRVIVFSTATITNGMNAMNVLGQSTFTASSSAATQARMNYPIGLAYDVVNSRLFVADAANNRVTIFNTATITNGMNAMNVLGQSTFTASSQAITQARLNYPQGLAYDAVNNRLFVAEYGNSRVTIFSTTAITNGMNAVNVLGQSGFAVQSAGPTQAVMSQPQGLAYDAVNNRLFVAEYSNNRVSVFNTASITDGMNAMNVLGQFADETASPLVPVYTKGTANNAPNRLGMSGPYSIAIDASNHRLFVADSGNNRVLIYSLTTDNTLADSIPDNVLGQSNFTANVGRTTQAGMLSPYGLAYDAMNNRLFVVESNNRVTVFNIATITNGMNASYVLGQSGFTTNANATTQMGMYYPKGFVYDAMNNRLFVADSSNNRVTVFNIATITNGMNAANVLGQSSYTANSSATTQAGMNSPFALSYDAMNNRLFVADSTNNRVTVFNIATITNGMNATYVLGQSGFTTNANATTQMGMYWPRGLAYDAVNNRLFVGEYTSNRVTVFSTAAITNGMNAISVLGQNSFTASATAATQVGMYNPFGLAYDSSAARLYVADAGNNRIMLFDVQTPVTTTSLTANTNPAAYGSGVILRAAVSPVSATGSFTFSEGATVLGTVAVGRGSGTLVMANLFPGSHTLTVRYAGSGAYAASTSTGYVLTMNKGMTTVSLSGSPNPSRFNENAVFTATVSPASATGAVSFRDGGVAFGTGVIAGGIASVSLADLSVGSHTVTAVYGGNSNFLGSLSDPLSQQVVYVTGTGTILGRVWDDGNGDGLRGAGEADGIENVTVTLSGQTTTGAALSSSQSTALSGDYSFSGILRSDTTGYAVTVDPGTVPSGWLRTTATSSGGIVLGTGAVKTMNAGFVRASTLSGSVFLDANRNGTKDGSETGSFSGITLTLTGTSATGGVMAQSVKTNQSGAYLFSGLPPGSGSFLLVSTVPQGYEAATTASRSVAITAGGQSKSESIGFAPLPAPVVSDIQTAVTASGVLITWTTDPAGSSQVEYGPDGGSLTASPEADSGTLVTDHAVMIDHLPSCVVFRFRVRSRDFLLQEDVSGESTFDTGGCPGLSDILAESGAIVTTESGGMLGLTGTGYAMILSVPEGAVSEPLTFQMTELDPLMVVPELAAPSGKTGVERFFTITALNDQNEAVRMFSKPLTITMRYGSEDIAGLDEATLTIWRHDGNGWTELSECTVDSGGKTVTCVTDHFSTFALFGSAPVAPAGDITPTAGNGPQPSTNRRPRALAAEPVAATTTSHAAANDVISVDISIPVTDVPGAGRPPVITPAERAAIRAEAARIQAQQDRNVAARIRAAIDQRRLKRIAGLADRVKTAANPETSFWTRVTSSMGAFIDGTRLLLGETQDRFDILTQNILTMSGDAWKRVVSFIPSAYRSIATRFDLQGELAQIRTSMEQSQTRHATTVSNQGGRLILASLPVTLLDADGNPYTHVPVVLFSTPQSGITDERGTVVFHDVELREHRLEIHTPAGTVKQRKIHLTSSTPASAVGTKAVEITIPEIRIVVEDDQQGFTKWTLLFIAAWSMGAVALGAAGGMKWMRRKLGRRR